MSFRAEVEAPRPSSAWIMVSVAGATLWITRQLDPWAIAVQVAAILYSLHRRGRAHAWQESPAALNIGMLGVVAGTILVALRGPPSTIALAHFAALTQGLQLIDARPRRTEFLLVALALFQVILAANLTDSVFFTPLLVAFLFAAVWTLLVHTLRTEALEAGDPRPVSGAITPGLLGTTLVASSLSVVLALLLFVALPRLRTSVLAASTRSGTVATAGFSDRVTLGDLGRIRQDPTVVLRVQTLEGRAPDPSEAFWRGLAFDHFDGVTWSVTPPFRYAVPGSVEGGVSVGDGPADANLVQRIVREPVAGGAIFGAGEIRALQGTLRHVERDAAGAILSPGAAGDRIRYTVTTRRWVPTDALLRRDSVSIPGRNGDRFLQLPSMSAAVASLAIRITETSESDADRVRAIERHLLKNGRYTDAPPSFEVENGRSPLEGFLLDQAAGHCEYFASAMVVLARSVGIPARTVNGFAGGHENRIGQFVELTRSDAHAWVEVHYRDAGWVRYDPTPPDLRTRPAGALGWRRRFREAGSAAELWWFQRVVGFDRSDQMRAMKSAWLRYRDWKDRGKQAEERSAPRIAKWKPGDLPAGAFTLIGVLLVAAAWWAVRGRHGRSRDALPAEYASALRILARRGLERSRAITARDFARQVGVALPPPAGIAFGALTEAYLAERFGGRTRDAVGPLRELRRALPRRRSRGGTTSSD